MDNRVIAKKIRIFRKQAGITQTSLAKSLGVSDQIMNHIERGRRYILAEELFTLAEALEVNIYDFGEWGRE